MLSSFCSNNVDLHCRTQHFILPKILLTRARMAILHQHQLSLYDKLLVSVHSLVYSNTSIHPKTQHRIAQRHFTDAAVPPTARIEDSSMTDPKNSDEKPPSPHSEEEEPLFADESPVGKLQELTDPTAATKSVTASMQLSLDRLRIALQQHPACAKPDSPTITVEESDENENTDAEVLPDQTPMQKSLKSLEELSTFLSNEAFYASTPAFPAASYGWNYSSASQVPQRSGMDRDKIAQIKNEIRSLKGMLLTRRNFAAPSKQDMTS